MKKLTTIIAFSAILLTACRNDNNSIAEIPPGKSYVIGGGTTAQATEKITETEAPKETVPPARRDAVSFDFESCENAPVLSGEMKALDWGVIFEEDCIVIGKEKYPAYVRICELSDNFKLGVVSQGSEHPDNSDMLIDYYTLYCLDKKICGISAVRTEDVKPTDAYIYTWTFGGFDEVPMEKLGLLGFSMTQGAAEVAAVYSPDENEGDSIRYYGVTESNGERFACSLSHSDGFITMLTITPYDVNPSAYEFYKSK